MNKLFIPIVALFLFAMVSVSSALYIDAPKILEVKTSSGLVAGPCYLQKIFLSSASISHIAGTDYAVAYITSNTVSMSGAETLTQVSPALIYTSTSPITGTQHLGAYEVINYGKPGIFINKSLILKNNATTSGEAFKAFIQYIR